MCPGAPVGVGMNIDIASIDMVSEVNMVSRPSLLVPLTSRHCLIKIAAVGNHRGSPLTAGLSKRR